MATKNGNAVQSLDGAKLKEVRQALNMNQTEFAESLDISQAALSYLEAGETTMSLAVFKNLINVFSVNPWTFLGNATNEPLFMKAQKARLAETELKNKLVKVNRAAEKIKEQLEVIQSQL